MSLLCPPVFPGVCSNSCTLSWWCYLTISSFAAPFSFNLSEKQYLYQWVSILHHVAKVLEFQLQHQPFQWIFRVDFLLDWLVWFLCSPRIWIGFLFPPPVDHILTDDFIMTCPSWVALHGTAHSFIELHKSLHYDKDVIHEWGWRDRKSQYSSPKEKSPKQ